MKKNGYVLLEMTISLGLFSLILLSASAILFNLANSNQILVKNFDKLENIRLAQYFLEQQINCCDKLTIEIDKNSTMKSLATYIDDNPNHTFEFKDKTIKFGGTSDNGTAFNNELSKNISDVKINYDEIKELLYIKIIVEDFPETDFVLYLKNKIISLKPYFS